MSNQTSFKKGLRCNSARIIKKGKCMWSPQMGLVTILVFAIGFAGCNVDGVNSHQDRIEPTNNHIVGNQENSLVTPKSSLQHQLSLFETCHVEALKLCFTEDLRDRITAEVVDLGREELAHYSFDQLFTSVQMGEYQGVKTAKVKMANGRTLTTFVLIDGKWLASTIWFR